MPQLDTSTWFVTVLASLITLFILMQLKVSSLNFYTNPSNKNINYLKSNNPWELKWTKIYLPLSLPLQ
ncbi:ATP synthase F0 subunit 8 (mitochondrion) [Phodopus roborovskii]|uniref:ATP synthase complex subunit 8 n=1 Tax=Phodopus roborovskii TaxID=109678 RepID=A0A342Z5C9_PHORO|nr:ATP synthase F0 subunit 8 [Phodopus roborovskii]AOT81522.1 ATP synthase F0 subunit 8 [Phodopus roborovskii]